MSEPFWSIERNCYSLYTMQARFINSSKKWLLPKFGVVEPQPLTPKIGQLIEAGQIHGQPGRIEVTTLGGLKLMLEGHLTAELLRNATCLHSCMELPLKIMNLELRLVIWSPAESRRRFEVVVADCMGSRLKWG